MTDNESTGIVPYMGGSLNLSIKSVVLDRAEQRAAVTFEVAGKTGVHAELPVSVPFGSERPDLSYLQRESGKVLLCELNGLLNQVGPVTNPDKLN